MTRLSIAISLAVLAGPACSQQRAAGDDDSIYADSGAPGPDSGAQWPDAGPQRPDAGDAVGGCPVPGPAIVSDIDETLTTSDGEWLWQMLFGDHDPAMRPGGPQLLHAYAERGYFIVYLTSRPADANLGFTGEPAYDATWRWLAEHGFPVDPAHTRLELSPSTVLGDAAAEYKGNALLDLQAEGFTFTAAYGNATTDIAAYATAGIPKDHTFIIGPHAGEESTVAIQGDGWDEHLTDYLPTVGPACQ